LKSESFAFLATFTRDPVLESMLLKLLDVFRSFIVKNLQKIAFFQKMCPADNLETHLLTTVIC